MIRPKIIYEDEALIVCHKPSGLAVQTASVGEPDLVSILKNHIAEERSGNNRGVGAETGSNEPIKGSGTENAKKPTRKFEEPYLAVVHRLDQPVEGLVVFARTKEAAANLSEQVRSHTFLKCYLALADRQKPIEMVDNVDISVENPVILTDFLLKSEKMNRSSVVPEKTPNAKKAMLEATCLGEWKGRFLFRIRLMTGRHHQIRVQMAAHGYPLAADQRYNDGPKDRALAGAPVALCAYELAFFHPVTGEKMHFKIRPMHMLLKQAAAAKSLDFG